MSPQETLDRLDALHSAVTEASTFEADEVATVAYVDVLVRYGPRLVAIAHGAQKLTDHWTAQLRDELRTALAALGGPDAPQEKPE